MIRRRVFWNKGSSLKASFSSAVSPMLIVDKNEKKTTGRLIGIHPESKMPIFERTLLRERYLQVGNDESTQSFYPVPKFAAKKAMTLDEMMAIISLPKNLGEHPHLKQSIILEVSCHELVLRLDGTRFQVPISGRLAVNNVTLERALTLVAAPSNEAPSDGRLGMIKNKMVHLMNGSNGYFMRYGQLAFDLPERYSHNPGAFTLDDAKKILASYRLEQKKKADARAFQELGVKALQGKLCAV